MKNIRIVEVKSEIGAGTRGSGLGIDAVKVAALDFGSLFFKRYKSVEIPDENKLLFEPVKFLYAKRISGLLAMYEKVSREIQRILVEKQSFPIVIEGDHSTTGATVTGIKMAYPDKRIGLIWIDAHADLHSPWTTPSGNLHGMVLGALLGDDNLEQKINQPDEETITLWNQLKNFGTGAPKILPSDMIYVGLRDMEQQEQSLISKYNIKNFSVNEIRKRGVERDAVMALNVLDHCDMIHVSFDVDCIDPVHSKGTGTPAPGGLSDKEAGNFIAQLMTSPKVCSFDMAEINPTLDKENEMAEIGFEILQKVTNKLTTYF
ncbi:MAG: arginase [Bacteroidetes bacterium]|nr:arginase [Bacteroidota bacterium]